jgi:hypothetical protein
VAILYPNEIVNVFIRDVEFTGTIVSVGNDGNYSYNYSSLNTAMDSVSSNTLILVYPSSGAYYTDIPTSSNKNLFIRGMGDSPEDVYISETSPLGILNPLSYYIVENMKIQNNSSPYGYDHVILLRQGLNSEVYFNKLFINNISSSSRGIQLADFEGTNPFTGMLYATNLTMYGTYTTSRPWGWINNNVSAIGIYYSNQPYSCVSCTTSPDPHVWSDAPVGDFGCDAGEFLIQFNVPPEILPETIPLEPLYQNVWAVGDRIYHTTPSGINVYNDAASILIDYIELPSTPTAVWANSNYIYMSTSTSGVYRSTISGIAYPYIQEPYITSNNTIYLHGADDFLCLTTLAGVDRYDLSTASGTTISGATRIFTYDQNIHKCFQTTSGTIYYIENNKFYGVDESISGLGDSLRNWKYYQNLSFTATTREDENVRVLFDFNFPYQNTALGGADIRFIDNDGNNLPYLIEEWYPSGSILVKVPNIGTDNFYMLYGNLSATAQSSTDAYYFYDDFSDLNNWSVYKGHANNYAVITNGYLDMYDYNNSGVGVVINTKMPYSLLMKSMIRRSGGTTTQFDGFYGYSTVRTKDRPNAGHVVIDAIQSGDENLHYLNAIDASIQGTKALSTAWTQWSAMWAPGYQMSIYDDELLERTSNNATFGTENYFMFHIDNSDSNPNLNVDWISFETWPENAVSTGQEYLLWELIKPKLHVVYSPTSSWALADYTYDEFYGQPLLLNDIHVTEETSSYNNNNTIFLATDRGAHVIEERQGDEENANIKRYYIS